MSDRDTALPTDPAQLLDTLDADAIQERLDEIARESRALRVLLRSARARQRPASRQRQEAAHAD
jgi:hypothetical protein